MSLGLMECQSQFVSTRASGGCGGICVGKLTTKWHLVAGDVHLEDDGLTICIENFTFDGDGINPDISLGKS